MIVLVSSYYTEPIWRSTI